MISLFCVNVYPQRTCGSEINMEQIQETDPIKFTRIVNWENRVQQYLQTSTRNVPTSTIVIPVVIHVIYNDNAQNISTEQILSQIQVLNEDYNRLNADSINTPTAFSNIAGKANIQFKLATIDPNGNPTTGITRTSTSINIFDAQTNNVKFTNLGGHDAWNTERYLNIWVCNLSHYSGYAQFPFDFSTSSNTDGVVISYQYFGRDGSAQYPLNKGRTATHEIGHWLNLYHIWGDDDFPNNDCVSYECSGTDYVSDTPNQGERSTGSPIFPKTDCCTTTAPGVMFMNFMDYTDDACMNMFTDGQIERMRTLFDTQSGIRKEMLTFANIITDSSPISGPSTLCASGGTYSISNVPTGATISWSCSNNISRQSNQGSNPCTFVANTNGTGTISATITYQGNTLTVHKVGISVGLRATMSGPTQVSAGSSGTWTANASCGNTPYQYAWYLKKQGTLGGPSLVGNGSSLTLWAIPANLRDGEPILEEEGDDIQGGINKVYYDLYVTVRDSHGAEYTPATKTVSVPKNYILSLGYERGDDEEDASDDSLGNAEPTLTLSPNPTGEYVDVRIDFGDADNEPSSYLMEILNTSSYPVRNAVLSGGYNRVSVQGLQRGYYVVRIRYGDTVLTKPLMVE